MAFKNECKNSLEAIDAGMSLTWLLTGVPFAPPDGVGVEDKDGRTPPTSSKRKKPKKPPVEISVPQAQGE